MYNFWRCNFTRPRCNFTKTKKIARIHCETGVLLFQIIDEFSRCHSCDLLLLPCGRSAHTEAGWMKGAGKRVVVYIPEMHEAELMYKLFDLVSGNLEELNAFLDRM